jgi:uncharacterized protein
VTIPSFLVPIFAGLFAQALKPIFNQEWRREQAERLDPRPRYGGMPSAHTAFATSLATIVILLDGPLSTTFAITVTLLIFILDDALRLRVFLGRFGIVIRRLVSGLTQQERDALPPIEQKIGHTIPEVLAGAVVGILSTIALWFLDTSFG